MNIKKMIPVFAIAMGLVLAMATSGFKEVPKSNSTNFASWYEFTGDVTQLNDVLDSSQYEYTSGIKPCNGASEICGVSTTGATTPNSHPNAFSSDLKSRLTDAFNGNNSYPDISQEQ
jgi:hypothetical protein